MDSSERIDEELTTALLEDSMKNEKETDKDLANQYVQLEQEKLEIDFKVSKFKQEHQEIFDTLEALEGEKQKLSEQQNIIKSKLLNKMTEKFEILGYSFVKVVTEIKRTFNSKEFYKDYLPNSRLYKKYVTESSVEPYVRITKLKKNK